MIAHARALLADAFWWRTALIGAVACTVLAVMFPPAGWNGGVPSSTYNPSPPSPSPSPSPVLPNPPPPPSPIDPQVQARLDTFRGAVAALATETSPGTRCERLADAADKLQPGDASGSADSKSVTEAAACQSNLAASDARFDALVSRAKGAREDTSARSMEALAEASDRLTAFDLTRGRAGKERDIIEAGHAAKAEVEASNKRLDALTAAAPGAKAGADKAAQEQLVEAISRLTPVDEQRLAPGLRDLLSDGRRLEEQLRASDARIAAVLSARDDIRQIDDDHTKQRLIAAVSRIGDYDRGRATEAQRATLADAAVQARDAALKLAVEAAASYERDPTVAACEQAAALAGTLGSVDRSTLTSDQQHALKVADRASLTMRESDRRIDALLQAEEAWQKDQSYGPGARLGTALSAITDFDRQRFSPEQREAFRRAEAAHLVLSGRASSLTPQTRGQVPIYVTASDPTAAYAAKLKSALRQAGYRLVPDRPSAAMVVDLQAEITSQGPRQIGSTPFEGALTEVELRSTWAIDQSDFFRATGLGNGIGGSVNAALATSYAKAADSLFNQFNSYVEQQGKQ